MSDPLPGQTAEDTNNWAMFTHLSALSGFVGVPFGHVVGPLILWLIKRESNPVLDAHGKEALNFQISTYIYVVISAILILLAIGVVLLPVVLLLNFIFTIIGAVKAGRGEMYRYPLTIRFLS